MPSKKNLIVICIILLLTLFIGLNTANNQPIAPGLHLNKANRQLKIYNPKGRDHQSYELYSFNDKEMGDILEAIQTETDWHKYPLDAVSSALLDEWHAYIKWHPTYEPILKESNYINHIKCINEGYYLVIDHQKDKASRPILERSSYNYSLLFIDLKRQTIHYFDLNT